MCLDSRGKFADHNQVQLQECVGDRSDYVSNLSFDLTAAGSRREVRFSNGTNTVKMWTDWNIASTTARVGQRASATGPSVEWRNEALPAAVASASVTHNGSSLTVSWVAPVWDGVLLDYLYRADFSRPGEVRLARPV